MTATDGKPGAAGRSDAAFESAGDPAEAQVLGRLIETLAPPSGERFFETLAKGLNEICRVDWVVMARIDPAAPETAHTRAICQRGEIRPNISYSLAGTPCENAVAKSFCWQPSGFRPPSRATPCSSRWAPIVTWACRSSRRPASCSAS